MNSWPQASSWFYIFDGLTSDSFASEQEAIAKLDRTTITGRSGGILDSIQQAFRPMIVRSMVCSRPSNLEPSEPPHTRKFALYRRVDKAPIANPTLLTITALRIEERIQNIVVPKVGIFVISQSRQDGYSIEPELVFQTDNEAEALDREEQLILQYGRKIIGTGSLFNVASGGGKGSWFSGFPVINRTEELCANPEFVEACLGRQRLAQQRFPLGFLKSKAEIAFDEWKQQFPNGAWSSSKLVTVVSDGPQAVAEKREHKRGRRRRGRRRGEQRPVRVESNS